MVLLATLSAMNYLEGKSLTKNTIFKAMLGAKNNLLYELCNNDPEVQLLQLIVQLLQWG